MASIFDGISKCGTGPITPIPDIPFIDNPRDIPNPLPPLNDCPDIDLPIPGTPGLPGYGAGRDGQDGQDGCTPEFTTQVYTQCVETLEEVTVTVQVQNGDTTTDCHACGSVLWQCDGANWGQVDNTCEEGCAPVPPTGPCGAPQTGEFFTTCCGKDCLFTLVFDFSLLCQDPVNYPCCLDGCCIFKCCNGFWIKILGDDLTCSPGQWTTTTCELSEEADVIIKCPCIDSDSGSGGGGSDSGSGGGGGSDSGGGGGPGGDCCASAPITGYQLNLSGFSDTNNEDPLFDICGNCNTVTGMNGVWTIDNTPISGGFSEEIVANCCTFDATGEWRLCYLTVTVDVRRVVVLDVCELEVVITAYWDVEGGYPSEPTCGDPPGLGGYGLQSATYRNTSAPDCVNTAYVLDLVNGVNSGLIFDPAATVTVMGLDV